MKRLINISETLSGIFKAEIGDYSFQITTYIDSHSNIIISGTLYEKEESYPCRLLIDFEKKTTELEVYRDGLTISDSDLKILAQNTLNLIRDDKGDISGYETKITIKN